MSVKKLTPTHTHKKNCHTITCRCILLKNFVLDNFCLTFWDEEVTTVKSDKKMWTFVYQC